MFSVLCGRLQTLVLLGGTVLLGYEVGSNLLTDPGPFGRDVNALAELPPKSGNSLVCQVLLGEQVVLTVADMPCLVRYQITRP